MKTCLALALVSLTLTARAAQSIDCKKPARGPTENTVCSTPPLLKIDSQMMADLDLMMETASGNQAHRHDVMSNWLRAFAAKRDWCGRDTACILALYKKQIAPMEAAIAQSRLQSGPGMGPR
jgi:uncharacterized protein